MIIALFNVISSIIMVILDKKTISKPSCLGADFRQMRSVFSTRHIDDSMGRLPELYWSILVGLQIKFGFVMITPTSLSCGNSMGKRSDRNNHWVWASSPLK